MKKYAEVIILASGLVLILFVWWLYRQQLQRLDSKIDAPAAKVEKAPAGLTDLKK